MDDLTQMLSGADAARPLTDELRTRLEEALLGRPSAVEADFRGIDEARPLPPKLHDKLRRKLERRRVAAWQIASAITAAAAVLIGIVVVPGSLRRPERAPVAIQPAPGTPAPVRGGGAFPAPSPSAAPGVVELPPVMAPGTGDDSAYRGSPPPFGLVVQGRGMTAPATHGGSRGSPAPPPKPRPVPARIVVTGADPDVRAGFNSYLAHVQVQGEVGNRTFEIVDASASGALVTVNLGSAALAGSSKVPRLEMLDVDASLLTGTVFDIASSPRRQARVLADQILERTDLEADSTPLVVIYRAGAGEFANTVPSEMRAIFEEAGIVVVTMDYEPGDTFVPADLAVVSMPPAEAKTFARHAREGSYSPRLGLAGIWSLYDDALRAELGTKATVVSPYWATGAEWDAIRRGVQGRGGRLGSEAIHGWAMAKAIAVVLYEANPMTPAQMASALGNRMLLGVCPYGLRSSSHERIPDGIMLEVTRNGVRAVSEFVTDSRP